MPNYTATTTITIGRGEKISASTSGNYDEVFNIRQVVDNTVYRILNICIIIVLHNVYH